MLSESRSRAPTPSARLPIAGPPILIHRADRLSAGARRIFDVIFASLLLVATLPIVAVAVLAIAIEDGRPAFFVQWRVGRYGRPFQIIKLRTMKRARCGSEYKPASSEDARITRVGRYLRATSIDELPQILNVLRGDMSVVGPRPEMPFVVERYQRWQHLRHLVRPGLTCIWQAQHRSLALDHPSATLLDLKYIRSASPALDVALVFRTIPALLRRTGAF